MHEIRVRVCAYKSAPAVRQGRFRWVINPEGNTRLTLVEQSKIAQLVADLRKDLVQFVGTGMVVVGRVRRTVR